MHESSLFTSKPVLVWALFLVVLGHVSADLPEMTMKMSPQGINSQVLPAVTNDFLFHFILIDSHFLVLFPVGFKTKMESSYFYLLNLTFKEASKRRKITKSWKNIEIIFCITNEISFTIISLSSSDKFFLESWFSSWNYYYITDSLEVCPFLE